MPSQPPVWNSERGVRLDIEGWFAAPALGLGGELKNTVCLLAGSYACISRDHGDLRSADSFRRFLEIVRQRRWSESAAPGCVGHDLHPLYLSTVAARRIGRPTVAVQHHHAHAVSAAAACGVPMPVIGVVCDGTGLGTDGASWGGEVLLATARGFQRLAHLAYLALPGGDLAAKETWRPALALLRAALPSSWRDLAQGLFRAVPPWPLEITARQLETGVNVPLSSSLGRLFDAVAALAGVCLCNPSEAEAAIALEGCAEGGLGTPYPYEVGAGGTVRSGPGVPAPAHGVSRGLRPGGGPGVPAAPGSLPHGRGSVSSGAAVLAGPGERGMPPSVLDVRPMVRAIVDDVRSGASATTVAQRFHGTIVRIFAEAALEAVERTGVDRVVLAGGCFFNRLLRDGLIEALRRAGIVAAFPTRVSPGDAGLSLGQALIAAATCTSVGSGSTVCCTGSQLMGAPVGDRCLTARTGRAPGSVAARRGA
jgi:hydrogenase maturation protein HypF